jgi:hypothetical protein
MKKVNAETQRMIKLLGLARAIIEHIPKSECTMNEDALLDGIIKMNIPAITSFMDLDRE